MKSFLLKIVLRLGTALALLVSINELCRDRVFTFWAETDEYEDNLKYILSGDSRETAISLGSSQTKHHYNSEVINEFCQKRDSNFKFLNLGELGYTPPKTFFILDEILDNIHKTKIKTITFELDSINIFGAVDVKRFYYWIDLHHFIKWTYYLLKDTRTLVKNRLDLQDLWRKYWNQLSNTEYYVMALSGKNRRYNPDNINLYRSFESLEPEVIANGRWVGETHPRRRFLKSVGNSPFDVRQTVPPKITGYHKILNHYVTKANSRGVQLKFVPDFSSFDSLTFSNLQESSRVHYHYKGLTNNLDYLFDRLHLNTRGSDKFSREIAEHICPE